MILDSDSDSGFWVPGVPGGCLEGPWGSLEVPGRSLEGPWEVLEGPWGGPWRSLRVPGGPWRVPRESQDHQMLCFPMNP